jgi:hypothetical protein
MKIGQKHLIKCRCILPQFKQRQNPPPHHFIVFSVLNEEDQTIETKYSQCNNCGVIHKIVDICKSEIQTGKENMNSLIKLEDIKPSLHSNFSSILEANNADLATWESVQFIVENKQWGNYVVLSTDAENDEIYGKYIRILGESICKVENFTRSSGVIS